MSDLFNGIANLTKSVTDTLNSYEVRKISDKVQGYVMNFTEPEMKVREATTEEPWGPTPDILREISGLTFQYDAFPEVMTMLWKRMLPASPQTWRRTYKSLLLLEHLLKNGCERVISNARDHIFDMKSLEHFKSVNERGRDDGINVRARVKQILELMDDDEKLRTERRKAKVAGKNDKYKGYSRDEMIMQGAGSSSRSFSSNIDRSDRGEYRDFDDDFDKNREVNAFDFEDGRREGSPELGIRMETPTRAGFGDEDDFGDFAAARGSKSATSIASSGAGGRVPISNDAFDDFGPLKTALTLKNDRIVTTPPSAASLTPPLPAKAEVDLLGLDLSAVTKPAAAAPNLAGDFDLFGISQPPSVITTVPQPTTLPKAPAQPANNDNLLADFAFPTATTHPLPAQPLAPQPLDLLTKSTSQHDDLLAGFTSSPSIPTTPLSPTVPTLAQASASTKPAPKPVASPIQDFANKSALWNDLSGSIDLDNLLSTKPKQQMSMNELKNRQDKPLK